MNRLTETALEVADILGHFALNFFGPEIVYFRGHYAGPRLLTDRRAAQAVVGPGVLEFAGVRWPLDAATKNFGLLGLPGTGKTGLVRVFCRSVGRRFSAETDRVERVLFFDAKNTELPFLSQVIPDNVPVYAVSPITGHAAIDFAPAVDTPARALKLANALVSDRVKSADGFWPAQARLVVAAVLRVFIRHAPDAWTLADLMRVVRDRRLARAVLLLDPETASQATDLSQRLGRSIVATVRSYLGELEIAAACWETAAVRVSPSDMARGRCCVHFGLDPAVAEAERAVYAASIELTCDGLLERTRHGELTGFFLDEVAQLPPIAAVRRLGLLGRESGAVLVVTLQDILSLEIAWGEKEAREFLNMLQMLVGMRVGYESAKGFCDRVGEREVVKRSLTFGGSSGYSESKDRERLLTESDLTGLPLADPVADRATGYCHTPFCDPFRFSAPFIAPLAGLPPPTLFPAPPRTAAQQTLAPLTLGDVGRLNLPLTDALLKAVSHP